MLISVKPGCIITKTPAKPKIIANNLLKNIFSFKKIIASKVANIGAVFPIAATSDNVEVERALNQKNKDWPGTHSVMSNAVEARSFLF